MGLAKKVRGAIVGLGVAVVARRGWRRVVARRQSASLSAGESPAPSDVTTVSEILESARDEGYGAQFMAIADGQIRCMTCRQARHGSQYAFDALRRMEGASDPDDAQVMLAVRCPACGVAGTLTLTYGPGASPEEADVFVAMRDRRGESSIPTGTAPGETETARPAD